MDTVHSETTLLIPYPSPLHGKLTSEFINRKSRVFHLETSEAKFFPVWRPLTIMLYYIYQAQQSNTCWRSIIEKNMKTWCEVCEVCLNMAASSLGRYFWLRFDFFIVNSEHMSYLILVSMLLILNRCMFCDEPHYSTLIYIGTERHHCPTELL